jgi:hypothetical protein
MFQYNLSVPSSRVKQSSWTVLWNVQSTVHCKNAVYCVYLWLVSHSMVSVTHFRIHRMHVWRTLFPWDIFVFNVYGSVHRKNIPIYIQQDATLHSLLYLETALHISSGTSNHHQKRVQVQGVSKKALQLWKRIEIYTEDIYKVLNCQNVAKHTEFYLG